MYNLKGELLCYIKCGNKDDEQYIAKYGKAYGAVLLAKWLPNINRTRNLFVLDSYEDFLLIEDKLPDIFIVRADAKTGEPATLGVEGNFVRKDEVKEYILKVKQSNPKGAVLCLDQEEGTREKVRTDGAFNVYLQMGQKVYIDYLGKGFDMGGITKGRENHETWSFDWNDALFVTPYNMNRYSHTIITQEQYLGSARRRLQQLLDLGYSREYIQGKVPKTYSPMPNSTKERLLDDILLPLYEKRINLEKDGLKSFGVQGTIVDGRLCPIEFNRPERFTAKEVLNKDYER